MGDPVPEVSQSFIPGPMQLTLTWPMKNTTLAHVETALGNFHLVTSPEASLKLSQPAPPPQAAVGVKVIEWQLPAIGPFIIDLAVKAALEKLPNAKPGAEGELEIKHKALKDWKLILKSDVHIESGGGSVHVTPQAPTIVIEGRF